MIFRIQIDGYPPDEGHLVAMLYSATGELPEETPAGSTVMAGLMGNPKLNKLMIDLGLPLPQLSNPRARFFFTDAGWRRFGRILFSEAKQLGHVMKVTCLKDPLRSQIVYEDKYQVAILPQKRKGQRADKSTS